MWNSNAQDKVKHSGVMLFWYIELIRSFKPQTIEQDELGEITSSLFTSLIDLIMTLLMDLGLCGPESVLYRYHPNPAPLKKPVCRKRSAYYNFVTRSK